MGRDDLLEPCHDGVVHIIVQIPRLVIAVQHSLLIFVGQADLRHALAGRESARGVLEAPSQIIHHGVAVHGGIIGDDDLRVVLGAVDEDGYRDLRDIGVKALRAYAAVLCFIVVYNADLISVGDRRVEVVQARDTGKGIVLVLDGIGEALGYAAQEVRSLFMVIESRDQRQSVDEHTEGVAELHVAPAVRYGDDGDGVLADVSAEGEIARGEIYSRRSDSVLKRKALHR